MCDAQNQQTTRKLILFAQQSNTALVTAYALQSCIVPALLCRQISILRFSSTSFELRMIHTLFFNAKYVLSIVKNSLSVKTYVSE